MALNNVPLSGQSLNDTRIPINQNFSVIDTAFQVDHVDYNDPNQGKHEKVTLPLLGGAAVFVGTDNGFYNLNYNNGSNTKAEVFVHKQTLAGTADIPFTASVLSSTAPSNDMVGWTLLPSGIMMRWDTVNIAASGNTNVNLGGGWPGFSQLFWVGLTPRTATNRTVALVSINSNTQFTIYASAAGAISFLAIGR